MELQLLWSMSGLDADSRSQLIGGSADFALPTGQDPVDVQWWTSYIETFLTSGIDEIMSKAFAPPSEALLKEVELLAEELGIAPPPNALLHSAVAHAFVSRNGTFSS